MIESQPPRMEIPEELRRKMVEIAPSPLVGEGWGGGIFLEPFIFYLRLITRNTWLPNHPSIYQTT